MEVSGQLQDKSPWYPLDRRMCGPWDWSGHGGNDKKFHHCTCQELKPGHLAHSLVSMLTKLTWLHHNVIYIRKDP
jgi:hypothetical protein